MALRARTPTSRYGDGGGSIAMDDEAVELVLSMPNVHNPEMKGVGKRLRHAFKMRDKYCNPEHGPVGPPLPLPLRQRSMSIDNGSHANSNLATAMALMRAASSTADHSGPTLRVPVVESVAEESDEPMTEEEALALVEQQEHDEAEAIAHAEAEALAQAEAAEEVANTLKSTKLSAENGSGQVGGPAQAQSVSVAPSLPPSIIVTSPSGNSLAELASEPVAAAPKPPMSPAARRLTAPLAPQSPPPAHPKENLDWDPFREEPLPPASQHGFTWEEGLVTAWEGAARPANQTNGSPTSPCSPRTFTYPTLHEYLADLSWIMNEIVASGPVKSFTYRRLQLLEAKFTEHLLNNDYREAEEQKSVPHRDFYNVRKIDNHVHHSACMNQKHLLRFIKSKLRTEADVEVIERDGKRLTLGAVFQSLNMTANDLSIDRLDMHAHNVVHRFDRFNAKYSPLGESTLREIFLKSDNFIKGRYLAEITREVFVDLESNKYNLAEYRVSIYGRKPDEWDKLAAWIVRFQLSSPNVRWMVQIPRLFFLYRRSGDIKSMDEMLQNIFRPLFEVTIDPSSHPDLHVFLRQLAGIDSVDDESGREAAAHIETPPHEWTKPENPPFVYWMYHLARNLSVLNQLRVSKGLDPIPFRPHAGECGDVEHLASAFLLAHCINHGLQLRKAPALQYLFYLRQIPISMSPLSNNLLFVEYSKNPFPRFFARGLQVTLSTDDPLMIHFTKEPLVEEYSVATQVWKLSSADMCEIARNSVLHSCFQGRFKKHWIGKHFQLTGASGNDIHRTNVPMTRVDFRTRTLRAELAMLYRDDDA